MTTSARDTGLKDREGRAIFSGDYVTLGPMMTADNSFGPLPNGWTFSEEYDVYEVYWDERINNWSLKLGVEPDSPYNEKYMNHALGIMHGGESKIILRKNSIK